MTKIDPTELQKILDEIGSTLQAHSYRVHSRPSQDPDPASSQSRVLSIGIEDELIVTLALRLT